MATPIANLPPAVAGLAFVAAMVGNAWADDTNVVPHAPAEMARWRSMLTDGREPHVNPEWKSTLDAIDPVDSAEFRAAQGAIGPRNVTQNGLRFSPGPFDEVKSARGHARKPPRPVGGNAGIGR